MKSKNVLLFGSFYCALLSDADIACRYCEDHVLRATHKISLEKLGFALHRAFSASIIDPLKKQNLET